MTEYVESIEPSASVAEANRAAGQRTSQGNGDDFKDAGQNLMAVPDVPVIPSRKDPSKVVWDFQAYDFLEAGERMEMPTVNGSLLRQSQLTAVAGLFLVSSGQHSIYQVRGYDLSNMTIVDGDDGLLVIDPLACYETAQYALKLFRDTTGNQKPVKALLYTHSHVDHFGGSRGLFGDDDRLDPLLDVIAPEGFLEHAVSENVYAGPAMARRAEYMYAAALPKSPAAQVGSGLGLTISTGEVTLIPPTRYVGSAEIQPIPQDKWQAEDVIPWRPGLCRLHAAGIRMIFQLTPGTEAPAEMNIYFPESRTLCVAENATHTMHNILSLRGAQVRDAHAWSKYLTEAIQTFGENTEVLFASHHWPRWGNAAILDFLGNQRDMYAYLNDQTLRLINRGFTGIEIAEKLQHLPAALGGHWYNQGYYGSLSHNLKAVYQRYMGWYDGNPAHLWTLPPQEAGVAYVAAMGGPEAVVEAARRAYESDTTHGFRWAAEILNHVVFAAGAEADGGIPAAVLTEAKQLQAKVFTQLGYGAENGPWRNVFLTGAEEIVGGPQPLITTQSSVDLVRSLSLEQYFSALARSVDGPRAAADNPAPIVLRWIITDTGQECTTTLRNGVLVYVEGKDVVAGEPQATISLTRKTLDALAQSPLFRKNFDALLTANPPQITLADPAEQQAADKVFATLTVADPKFPIVTPRRD